MASHSPEIRVNPSVLKWARESMGLDLNTAAKKISVKPELIERWEEKEHEISIARLRKVANTYKRSLSLFLLPAAPTVATFPPDFRTLDSTKADKLSPGVRLAVRKAQRNREFYIELIESLGQKTPHLNLSFSLDENPIELAEAFRKRLGIKVEIQIKEWEDKSAALKEWIAAVENLGILVFQMSLPIKELRAFCLRDHSLPPAIVLNTKDDVSGRIFSLFHEVSHLLIKQSDIDQLTNRKGEYKGHEIVEWFANNFAGSFLVPEASLRQNAYAKYYLETKSDNILQRLKGQYKVSSEVILRRFFDLGFITEKEYREKKKAVELEIEKYLEKKKQKDKEKNKKGFRSVSMESFQRAGKLLTSKAFNAMEKGVVSGADVARFYEIKQGHIGKIKQLLDGRANGRHDSNGNQ